MAKGRRNARSQDRLAEIITRYVNILVNAVQQEVRRSVAEEVQGFLTGGRAGDTRSLRRTTAARRRVLPCIAPSCNNPSKGPRFHYLCEKHKDAPRKDYEAWRKARQEKQAA